MKIRLGHFPKPKIKIEAKDGYYIVITNNKQKPEYIILSADYDVTWQPLTTLGISHITPNNTVYHIDLIKVLNDYKLSVPFLRLGGYSLFGGLCENGIFQADVTLMFKGKILGQE